jgi:hypothetical protein
MQKNQEIKQKNAKNIRKIERESLSKIKSIVGNYSEKNCRKFYRGKILRKIFAQNFAKKKMCILRENFRENFLIFFS